MPRPLSADDLYLFRWIDHSRLDPTGRRVAFHVAWTDRAGRENRSRIFVQDLAPGSAPKEVSQGPKRDHTPSWAPDGNRLAYVARHGARDSIHVLNLESGDDVRVATLGDAMSSPKWSADGRLAFLATVLADPAAVVDDPRPPEHEGDPRRLPVARVVRDFDAKADGRGYTDGRHDLLFVLGPGETEPRCVTPGTRDVEGFEWGPGGELVVAGNFEPGADLTLARCLYLVQPDGRRRTLVSGLELTHPVWSPRGDQIAFAGHEIGAGGLYARIYVVSVPEGEVRCLTAGADLSVGDGIATDMRGGHPMRLVWDEAGERIYFLASGPGRCGVHSVDLRGEVRDEIVGPREVFDFDRRAGALVFCAAGATDAGDLYRQDGGEHRVTNLNPWLDDRDIARPQQLVTRTPDGLDIEGWYLTPPGFDRQRRYPLVMQIHGGPHGQYGHSLFHEFQVLAGLGFVVFYTNPRGSNGYGEAFQQACVRDWAGKDYGDLMGALDNLLSLGFVDESRMGVAGGSYGGYMTAWIIGHTDRFAAAVAMRCLSDLVTWYAQSDIVPWAQQELGAGPWPDLDELWRRSPIRNVQNIHTPLLLTHGEMDLRCDIYQSEELFGALRVLGREVELVRFPQESHELSRSGRPDRRVERLNRISGWFERHLQDHGRFETATPRAALD